MSKLEDNQIQVYPHGQVAVHPAGHVGVLGEAIAAQWLMNQGWQILHHRWRCRWGEIDLIAYHPGSPSDSSTPEHVASYSRAQRSPIQKYAPRAQHVQLAFVEVKVRSRGNWDAGGLLAITPQKQGKLLRAAEQFLSEQTQFTEVPCRFDVALIRVRRSRYSPSALDKPLVASPETMMVPKAVPIGQMIPLGFHQLSLEHYIENAFDTE